MLEGANMTLGNRYTYTIFIDNGLIYSERGREIRDAGTIVVQGGNRSERAPTRLGTSLGHRLE